jgi:hypothetical protein
MKKIGFRLLSHMLILCMAGLPFTVHAGLISTDEVVAQHTSAERAKVHDFLARADVVEQLQQEGISTQAAQQRVDALTDNEVRNIAGQIDSLPAGATAGGAAVIGLTILLVALTYVILRLIYPYK